MCLVQAHWPLKSTALPITSPMERKRKSTALPITSPMEQKLLRFQEARRPDYATFKRKVQHSSYPAYISNAALGHVHQMFSIDYPRFDGHRDIVCAGFLVAHMGIRRGLGKLRIQNKELFHQLPEFDQWRFEMTCHDIVDLDADLAHLLQAVKAWLNWSPIVLDMQDWAQNSEGEIADRAQIPRRRTIAQCMCSLPIHDMDKPAHPEDASVRDPYGSAIASAFFAQECTRSRIAVILTGTLGRSTPIAQRFLQNRPSISTQSDLDTYIQEIRTAFAKPRNADYSVRTSSVDKQAKGYIGRGFDKLVKILYNAADEGDCLANVTARTLKALPNFGEFLNSHLWFQLLLLSKSYLERASASDNDSLLKFLASLQLDGRVPRSLVSRRNTLKFFTAMSSSGARIAPIPLRELPQENIPFSLLRKSAQGETETFLDSVIRKLHRAQRLELHFRFCVDDSFDVEYTVHGSAFRFDNALVQACMAEKVRALMGEV